MKQKGAFKRALGGCIPTRPCHFFAAAIKICNNVQTKHSNMLPRAAIRKMASLSLHLVRNENSDTTQRSLMSPQVENKRAFRQVGAILFTEQKNVKESNPAAKTCCIFLSEVARGGMSSHILLLEPKMMAEAIQMKQRASKRALGACIPTRPCHFLLQR